MKMDILTLSEYSLTFIHAEIQVLSRRLVAAAVEAHHGLRLKAADTSKKDGRDVQPMVTCFETTRFKVCTSGQPPKVSIWI